MAYTDPTATQIKTRFAEFASVADGDVDAAIAEAKIWVDSSWPEVAYTLALTYRAAHQLKLAGFGTPLSVNGVPLSGISGFSITDFSVTRGKAADLEVGGGETSTLYGREFAKLRDRYFGGGVLTTG